MTTVCKREVTLPDYKDKVAVITYVRDKLLEQGKPSQIDSSLCAFRGRGNCACALGWLIPDADISGMDEDLDLAHTYLLNRGMDGLLINELRNTHDRENVTEWSHRFNQLIEKYL